MCLSLSVCYLCLSVPVCRGARYVLVHDTVFRHFGKVSEIGTSFCLFRIGRQYAIPPFQGRGGHAVKDG